jgi:hypothetical protein
MIISMGARVVDSRSVFLWISMARQVPFFVMPCMRMVQLLPRLGCLLLPRRSSPAPWAASVPVLKTI